MNNKDGLDSIFNEEEIEELEDNEEDFEDDEDDWKYFKLFRTKFTRDLSNNWDRIFDNKILRE